ncbi:TlpA family protein disulfide reductase [Candidatus Woesearchaeota archaeon]|nr:TlpA family protein disulfide reductase [Candidatus Woesearchaeota archaeon]
MSPKTYFKIFFITLALISYGCTNSNQLELKSKTENQDLNQVMIIGTRIGEIPPDFTVVTTEGKAVRLKDLIDDRKPVIVYFMATWCPWCAKDYTALSKIYKDYEDKVSIISISLDLSEDLIKLQEYKKKYPELQSMMLAPGQEKILIDYSATKTTTKYAIGRNGTIIYRTIGAFDEEQWKQLLDALSKG